MLASGRARTSLSWTRLNPSMADPSKVMPSSSAFSSSAGVMLNVFGVPENVGEPELDEADAALLHRPEDVLLLTPHGVVHLRGRGALSGVGGSIPTVSQVAGGSVDGWSPERTEPGP